MNPEILQQLGLAVGLGLLIGFQREWTAPHIAGIRTFTLLSLMGTLTALVAQATSYWLLAAGFVVAGSVLVVGSLNERADNEQDKSDDSPGLTTHVAALVMFLIGAGLVFLPVELPILLTGIVALLLHWKQPLHAFVDRMGEKDVRAIIQMVLLALVILPVLPDRAYDRYGVLNPFDIWLKVVLICGITLSGYIAYRFMGHNLGTLFGGALGGVISSTATTVSYSRSSREGTSASSTAMVILIASTVVFLRVFVEVAVVDASMIAHVWPPFLTLMLVMAGIAAGMYWLDRPADEDADQAPPSRTNLTAAIAFGVLYAGVLLGVAWAKDYFGEGGLYVVAALSGLTDMDAITLSTTRLVGIGQVDVDTGWRMILTGVLSNLLFKGGIVASLGSRKLLKRIGIAFSAAIAVGLLLLLFWPPLG